MSSRRRLRRKSCEGKQRHETWQQANAHAISQKHATGDQVQAYRCRFGDHYHVGHRFRA